MGGQPKEHAREAKTSTVEHAHMTRPRGSGEREHGEKLGERKVTPPLVDPPQFSVHE